MIPHRSRMLRTTYLRANPPSYRFLLGDLTQSVARLSRTWVADPRLCTRNSRNLYAFNDIYDVYPAKRWMKRDIYDEWIKLCSNDDGPTIDRRPCHLRGKGRGLRIIAWRWINETCATPRRGGDRGIAITTSVPFLIRRGQFSAAAGELCNLHNVYGRSRRALR